MSEEKIIIELNDEELSKVTGGFTQNADGTYNILKDEYFASGHIRYYVLDDNYNVGLDEYIRVEYYILNPNHTLSEFGIIRKKVKILLEYSGYLK